MSDLNNFFNYNSNDNNDNKNKNNNNSVDDFNTPGPNHELEIEDNRDLVDSPDTNYDDRSINDNSNMINLNHLPNAKFDRDYYFDDDIDKKTIIKNVILITIVVIIGFFLVYNFSGVKKEPTPTPSSESSKDAPTRPDSSSAPTEDSPVVEEDGTIKHSDDEMYLEVSTSKTIEGSGIEQIGKEKFYKSDMNREINSNGVSFIIKKFSDKEVTIVLNTELSDTSSTVPGCKKHVCSAGTEVTLDGKMTIIFETLEKDNKTNYSFNVYNIKY